MSNYIHFRLIEKQGRNLRNKWGLVKLLSNKKKQITYLIDEIITVSFFKPFSYILKSSNEIWLEITFAVLSNFLFFWWGTRLWRGGVTFYIWHCVISQCWIVLNTTSWINWSYLYFRNWRVIRCAVAFSSVRYWLQQIKDL